MHQKMPLYFHLVYVSEVLHLQATTGVRLRQAVRTHAAHRATAEARQEAATRVAEAAAEQVAAAVAATDADMMALQTRINRLLEPKAIPA